MRFLNTTTLQFEEVSDSEIHFEKNRYDILPHRWSSDEDEISYEDMLSLTDHYSLPSKLLSRKKGFAKIKEFCDLAASENCRYSRVDTCCINKRNLTELTEAINSMYLWYKGSKIYVVYLEDVPRKPVMDSE
jgi:hypothetical protein